MFVQPHQPTPLVPFAFPAVSYDTLLDFNSRLARAYGGVYWPLDDAASAAYLRAINPALAKGRNVVIDPTMDVPATWTAGTGWSVTGGKGVATAAAVSALLSTTTAVLQIGRVFEISYDLVVTSGTVRVEAGTGGAGTTQSVSGTYVEKILCASTAQLRFNPQSAFTGTIDNVTAKELNIPASDAVPVQLLDPAVWNTGVITAWTAGNSASVTAATVTRHDGISGTVVKVARNGVNAPYALFPATFTLGQAYRIFGWMNSDGLDLPKIFDGNGTALFTGIASTDSQPFDFPWVANTTTLRFGSSGTTGTRFVQLDVTVVSLDTGIRQGECVQNGSLSADASFVKAAGWTITGGQAVATAAAIGAGINQLCLCIGKTYLLTVTCVTYTSGSFRLNAGATGTTQSSTGTFAQVLVATTSSLVLNPVSTLTATFDNISAVEISPLSGLPINGVVTGNSESPVRVLTSAVFDGVNDAITLLTSQWNAMWDATKGTLLLFIKPQASIWTSGATAYFIRLIIGSGTDEIRIAHPVGNGQLVFTHIGASTAKTTTLTSQSFSSWTLVAVTWDQAGSMIPYFNNAVQTSQTALGTQQTIKPITFSVGAGSVVGANPALASEMGVLWLPTVLSASEIAEIAKLGDGW